MSHDTTHSAPLYSFKHDTSNLAIVSILFLCLSVVVAALAATYIVFHKLRDDERVVKSVVSDELTALRKQEQVLLGNIEGCMDAVVEDYWK